MQFDDFHIGDLAQKPTELVALLDDNRRQVEELLAQKEPTYQSFVRALNRLDERTTRFFTPVAIVQQTKNSDETRKAYDELLPLISEYETQLSQDERIYAVYKRLAGADLTGAQRKALDDSILEFEMEGAGKNEAIKDRIKAINVRISELGNSFGQNLLDATKAFSREIDDPRDTEGIPPSDLAAFAIGENRWRFTLLPHSYHTVMTYCPNAAIREEFYRAYTTRSPENGAIIEEMLAIKNEKAKLLGYENYAEYSIKTKMAASAKEAEEFVLELINKCKTQAQKELVQLADFARENGEKRALESFDTAYWSKKLEKSRFDLDDELYKPYFEAKSVMNGLFEFLQRLFGVVFTEIQAPKWDESVRVFELTKDGAVFARFYADLYEREEKRGGAWMDNWQSRMIDENGERSFASAYISCNFPAPSVEGVSLLRHDDVVTLFHEMGHTIHHLFSAVDEREISGVSGVEWDAVEFPSQWLENFAYERSVLKLFAKHYQTGEVLSDEMIDKLIVSKNFMSATAMLRQNEFALFDLRVYQGAFCADRVQEILDTVRELTALIKPPKYNKFQNGFSHIFGGGYAAGYYSYKWAEVLSADAFYRFVDRGIFDRTCANSFVKEVLGAGGSRTASENFAAFMGRAPDSSALLRLSGIER